MEILVNMFRLVINMHFLIALDHQNVIAKFWKIGLTAETW